MTAYKHFGTWSHSESHEKEPTQDESISGIEFREGSYEITLPWNQSHRTLPDNYELSRGRLHGLLKCLHQIPVLLRDYNIIIQEQIISDIVEDALSRPTCPAHLHYLSHHVVVCTDKNIAKIRIDCDASANKNGDPFLNACLLTGPKFKQMILDILVRIRSHRIVLTADVKKAF